MGRLWFRLSGWQVSIFDMGGCQNHGPFLGTLNNRCRIILGTQKGTLILTTTHMNLETFLAPWHVSKNGGYWVLVKRT